MKISIVIVNWNTRELLRHCLQTVLDNAQSLLSSDVEVFVVDNASSDDSADMIQKEFAQIRLLESSENLGFATANNRAIRQCTGEYILLLNPDTELKPGALAMLIAFMDEHTDAGVAGAKLLNTDGTLQESSYPFPTLSRELWRLLHLDALRPYGVYRMDAWPAAQPRKVDTVQGACLVVRRTALEQVGLLDEDYFMYTEEVDLCYRIQQAGWGIYWAPRAQVVHHGGQSTRQVAPNMFLHLYGSKVLFFRKRYGTVSAQLYKVVLFTVGLLRMTGTLVAPFKPSKERHRYRMLAANYRRLLFALPAM